MARWYTSCIGYKVEVCCVTSVTLTITMEGEIMSASTYEQLRNHVGHEIECVEYGDGDNIAIECLDCCEVLIDFDAPVDADFED